jgi:hypothetical protein
MESVVSEVNNKHTEEVKVLHGVVSERDFKILQLTVDQDGEQEREPEKQDEEMKDEGDLN